MFNLKKKSYLNKNFNCKNTRVDKVCDKNTHTCKIKTDLLHIPVFDQEV